MPVSDSFKAALAMLRSFCKVYNANFKALPRGKTVTGAFFWVSEPKIAPHNVGVCKTKGDDNSLD